MLEKVSLDKVLFLDIETVPAFPDIEQAPEEYKKLWEKKAEQLKEKEKEDITPEELYEKAGIYAEFGKIICISVGYLSNDKGSRQFRVKSFFGHDEKIILENFCKLLDSSFNSRFSFLCAHNGKEFDFPYLTRRIIINHIPVPEALETYGKKPWEIEYFLDTLQMWRFGDYKSYTSLALLCYVLGIPTPKDDIEGKDVWRVYYLDNDLERIVNYCEKDVLAVARLFLRFKSMPGIEDEEVVRINV